MRKNFYCQRVCGEVDFSIDEWNRKNKLCNDLNIEGIERDRILNPDLFPCEIQCDECINIVLDTQEKNKNKIKVWNQEKIF